MNDRPVYSMTVGRGYLPLPGMINILLILSDFFVCIDKPSVENQTQISASGIALARCIAVLAEVRSES